MTEYRQIYFTLRATLRSAFTTAGVSRGTAAVACALFIASAPVFAYSSGSTGADGALNPTVDTDIQLPASGVFNYTTVNIPAGVKVTFRKNTTNTPVTILATGDVTIAGTLDVSGKASADVGTAGDGGIANDGLPGAGGPGGYDGGQGGPLSGRNGASGLGPGGGGGGLYPYSSGNSGGNCTTFNVSFGTPVASGGAGGGFANQGGAPQICGGQSGSPTVGGAYGATALLPLVGGSGGGGGAGGQGFVGSGGGGGGGAVLIASSGIVNVTGSVLAKGGGVGTVTGSGAGASGGGGSGGAIRVIATTINGNGTISAQGAVGGAVTTLSQPAGYLATTGGAGSDGRIRFEAETLLRTAATAPIHTAAAPGSIFVSGQPTLSITNVAGTAAPASPTGVADVQLPATVTNPVTVTFATTGVPTGNTVKLLLTPPSGAIVSATSTALSGSTSAATASATITLPQGASTLQATITYTVIASLGDTLSRYANNERVEKITLVATLGGRSEASLITVSGKAYPAPAAALLALGG